MNYKLLKGKKPRIEAKYLFDCVYVTAYPYDFHSSWMDWLFWNEKTFSFYDARVEDEKIELGSESDNQFRFRLKVERNRKKIIALPPLPQKMWEGSDVERYWEGISL